MILAGLLSERDDFRSDAKSLLDDKNNIEKRNWITISSLKERLAISEDKVFTLNKLLESSEHQRVAMEK